MKQEISWWFLTENKFLRKMSFPELTDFASSPWLNPLLVEDIFHSLLSLPSTIEIVHSWSSSILWFSCSNIHSKNCNIITLKILHMAV